MLFNSLVCEKNTLNKPLLDGRKNKNSYIKDKKKFISLQTNHKFLLSHYSVYCTLLPATSDVKIICV